MILLPLLLASALATDPNVQTKAYRECVVQKAAAWAKGPDPAQVIVKTAEGVCDAALTDLKIALIKFAMAQKEAGHSLPTGTSVREFVDTGAESVVEGVRSLALATVLEVRSK